jgi:hypothetical protein
LMDRDSVSTRMAPLAIHYIGDRIASMFYQDFDESMSTHPFPGIN